MNWEDSVTAGYNSSRAMMATTNDTDAASATEAGPPPDGAVFGWAAKVALTAVIAAVSGVGILGNAAVVFIVFRYRDMHTVINYSFANLALTDLTLLVLDGVPTAADTMDTNLSAKLGCNIPIYLQYISAEVSSLTLAFLSYDRYRLIVHPMKTIQRRSPSALLKIFVCIWLASFITQIPTAPAAGLTAEGACSEYSATWGQEYFFSYILASLYIAPFGVIVVCYAKIGRKMLEAGPPSSMKAHRRRRSVNMILGVIVLYALCWAPVHVVHMWMAFDPGVNARSPLYVELHTAANVLIFFNSSVNPFVYALIGPSFRRHISAVAVSLAKCQTKEAFADHRSESNLSLYSSRYAPTSFGHQKTPDNSTAGRPDNASEAKTTDSSPCGQRETSFGSAKSPENPENRSTCGQPDNTSGAHETLGSSALCRLDTACKGAHESTWL